MVHRIRVSDKTDIENKLSELYSQDYSDSDIIGKGISQDDRKWRDIMNSSCTLLSDNRYQIDLPMRNVTLPNNRNQVFHGFLTLIKKLKGNNQLYEDYKVFMDIDD